MAQQINSKILDESILRMTKNTDVSDRTKEIDKEREYSV